jgi:hypothetical protein
MFHCNMESADEWSTCLWRLQCGCQCTQCCFNGDLNNCTRMEMAPCPYECKAVNRSACGIQFSKPRQAPFCAIPHTSSWPAILQVGRQQQQQQQQLQRLG